MSYGYIIKTINIGFYWTNSLPLFMPHCKPFFFEEEEEEQTCTDHELLH